MRTHRFRNILTGIALAISSPLAVFAQDALPACDALFATVPAGPLYSDADYDAVRRGCTLTWVENNTLRNLTWRYYADDFEAPILRTSPDGRIVLTSQQPPRLIDMDQDGTRDLLTFNLIGMVNGDFDIFLSSIENHFVHAGTVNGEHIARDQNGTLIAEGRNGARAFFHFFNIAGQNILPLFDVDPQDTCVVTTYENGSTPSDALIDHYCKVYEDTNTPSRQMPLESDDQIAFVPVTTVFYCQLDASSGRREVTLSATTDGLRYTYGPIGRPTELTLESALDDVEIVGEGEPEGVNTVSLRNGAYSYTIATPNDPNAPIRLIVSQHGRGAPVFDASCDPRMTYAGLF